MPIPKFKSVMLPLLKYLADEKERGIREAIIHISDSFQLTEEERRKKLPSGHYRIIDNRVWWARTYLKKAGLLEYPGRGRIKITDRGMRVLEETPAEINVKFLMKFPEFVEFRTPKTKEIIFTVEKEETETPEELIEQGSETLKENLIQELLEKLRKGPPEFFEQVVVDLLKKMGYGEGEVVGGSYDGGVDGIIYQDPLRIDKIYLQAKRHSETNTIGQSTIRNFIGALETKGATKGVFITTSSFQSDAEELIKRTPKNLVLINGEKLVELMIEHNLGVSIDKTYEIKKIDIDYFEEQLFLPQLYFIFFNISF